MNAIPEIQPRPTGPLSPDLLEKMHAYWRAANHDRFDGNITTTLKTGDELSVEPELGRVTVLRWAA